MPGTTPEFDLPYPVLGESPHGPDQLRDLAEAVEAAILTAAPPVVTVAEFAGLTPADGDEVYLAADAANGVYWHLRYNATANDWHFLGGSPLRAEVLTEQTLTSTSYTVLGTAVELTVPVLGAYFIGHGARIGNSAGARNATQSVKYSAAEAVDADSVDNNQGADLNVWTELPPKAITAGQVVSLRYKTSGDTTGRFSRRRLFLTPHTIG